MASASSPRQNRLLANLPKGSIARLRPHLELVPMPVHQVVYARRAPFKHVFFPTTSAVSLVSNLQVGAVVEVGIIGNEGMVGTMLLVDDADAACAAVVQCGGEAYRMPIEALRAELQTSWSVLLPLLRYMQALHVQTAQTAICIRHHSVIQQLCRRLLMLDRIETDGIGVTHTRMAERLGVRRSSVTIAAGKLREAGVIAYHRGLITVLDRVGLAAQACECYETVKRETDRLVPVRSGRPISLRRGRERKHPDEQVHR
jgi:CRP-like cAMP-binding protein